MKKNTVPSTLETSVESYISQELMKRGFVTSITTKDTSKFDLVVSDEKLENIFVIQVKSSKDMVKTKKWKIKISDLVVSDKLIYIFSNLPEKKTFEPEFYIFSSRVVSDRVGGDTKDLSKKSNRSNSSKEFILDDESDKPNNWEDFGNVKKKKGPKKRIVIKK